MDNQALEIDSLVRNHVTDINNLTIETLKEQVRILQKSRDRYFDLYNFAPAGYLTLNFNGIILDANLTTTILFNKKRPEIIGKNIINFISREDIDLYNAHVKNLIETRTRQACIIRMLKNKDEVIYARIESDFAQDEKGNQTQCSVFLDVSECKLAEQNLKKTVEALYKSNTELERFAYVASHDLREPLHNISSCTQLLDMNYSSLFNEEGKQLISYILSGVTQMNSLISDLLSYSSNGNNPGRFELIDSQVVLLYAIENLNQLILENSAIITHDKTLPEVIADSAQMVQLFQNLISNAIKHHGGNTYPEIHIGAKLQENYWVFSVKDNGIGIEEQYLDKIFEIFRRLETRSKYRGTGIGLAICKQIVEKHNGNIWVESELEKGSTFYFTLPA